MRHEYAEEWGRSWGKVLSRVFSLLLKYVMSKSWVSCDDKKVIRAGRAVQ